jgi:hypothetical protein
MPTTNNQGSRAETFMQAFEQIAEGGLLRLVVSRPVQQAIGRLVSGITDVPVAYLEAWSQRVRDDTTARKKITAAVASSARALVSENKDLAERGLERWTRQLEARQNTREDIARRTLDVLAEEEIPTNASAPSEDFMRMFENIAENVSSAELADLMARILAGEIRKPGSVSRRTLQIVTILDHEIVAALNELSPYLLNSGWMHIPPSGRERWYPIFALLSSVSITNEAGARTIPFDHSNECCIPVHDKIIILTARYSKGGWFVDGVNLTPIGRELIATLPVPVESNLDEIAIGMKELFFVDKVEIADIDRGNLREII